MRGATAGFHRLQCRTTDSAQSVAGKICACWTCGTRKQHTCIRLKHAFCISTFDEKRTCLRYDTCHIWARSCNSCARVLRPAKCQKRCTSAYHHNRKNNTATQQPQGRQTIRGSAASRITAEHSEWNQRWLCSQQQPLSALLLGESKADARRRRRCSLRMNALGLLDERRSTRVRLRPV